MPSYTKWWLTGLACLLLVLAFIFRHGGTLASPTQTIYFSGRTALLVTSSFFLVGLALTLICSIWKR